MFKKGLATFLSILKPIIAYLKIYNSKTNKDTEPVQIFSQAKMSPATFIISAKNC